MLSVIGLITGEYGTSLRGHEDTHYSDYVEGFWYSVLDIQSSTTNLLPQTSRSQYKEAIYHNCDSHWNKSFRFGNMHTLIPVSTVWVSLPFCGLPGGSIQKSNLYSCQT